MRARADAPARPYVDHVLSQLGVLTGPEEVDFDGAGLDLT